MVKISRCILVGNINAGLWMNVRSLQSFGTLSNCLLVCWKQNSDFQRRSFELNWGLCTFNNNYTLYGTEYMYSVDDSTWYIDGRVEVNNWDSSIQSGDWQMHSYACVWWSVLQWFDHDNLNKVSLCVNRLMHKHVRIYKPLQREWIIWFIKVLCGPYANQLTYFLLNNGLKLQRWQYRKKIVIALV